MITSTINPMTKVYEYNEKLFVENQEIDWTFAILGNNLETAMRLIVISQGVSYAVAVYLV